MKAVVFGGSGFLGRSVVRRLGERGASVTCISNVAGPGVQVADITDAGSLRALELEADVVFNLAACLPSGPNTLNDHAPMFSVNAVGAANVAHWAIARRARRLIQCSTLVVASRPWPAPLTEDAPTSPTGPVAAYAASKLAGELVAGSVMRAGGASFVALRLSALYGPGMTWTGVLPAFIDGALAGRQLTATRGAHADFLHVEDAARFVAGAADSDLAGVVNAASGMETSIVELAELVLSACGRSPDELSVVDGAVGRAAIDVSRLNAAGLAAEVPLSRGIAELVQLRRADPS